ncbi:hypothetical protein KP509_15G017000 [Ceratopteris richardii]|nr:hypothetical protein KP509_15G017000 [Ceratopteris richardii]
MERGSEVWSALCKAILNAIVHIIFFSPDFPGSPWCVKELIQIMKTHDSTCSSHFANRKLLPVYYNVKPDDVLEQPTDSAYNPARLKRLSSEDVRHWTECLSKLKKLVYNNETTGMRDATNEIVGDSEGLWEFVVQIVEKVEALLEEVKSSNHDMKVHDSESSSSLMNEGHISIVCYCRVDTAHQMFIDRVLNTFKMLGLEICWKERAASASLQTIDYAETHYGSNEPHCENGGTSNTFSNFVEISFEQPIGQLEKLEYKVNVDDKVEYKVMVDEVLELLSKENKMIKEVIYFPIDRLQRQDEIEACIIDCWSRSNDSLQCVGLLGEEGVGKTTVAKLIYERIHQHFEHSCFCSRITTNVYSNSFNLVALQKQILEDLILGDKKQQHVKNTEEGGEALKNKLKDINALIVLNDVGTLDHLKALSFPLCGALGPKSIVLITSSKPDILVTVQSRKIVKIERLDKDSSRRLFYHHAFMKGESPVELKELAEEVIDACEGRPLLLKTIGADLYHNSSVSYWNERLCLLKRYTNNTFEKLKISLEGLDSKQKNAFLDICCFLIGEKEEVAYSVLEGSDGIDRAQLNELKSRCLISTHGVGEEKRITMHDRLRDMGRHIIRENEKNRAWDEETIKEILEDKRAILELRVLSAQIEVFCETKISQCTVFDKVRILEVKADTPCWVVDDSRDFMGKVCCDELRLLRWRGASFGHLPSGLCSEKLRVLDLSHSNIKEMPTSLRNLVILELQSCSKFERFTAPFDTSMPSLRRLNLFKCKSLTGLDPSIQKLNNLTYLDVGLCGRIRIPDEVKKLYSLQGLSFLPKNIRILNLSSCSNLKSMDDVSPLENLEELDISCCTNLTHLSTMHSLRKLDLNACNALEGLDSCFKDFSSLQELNLSNCTSLKTLSCLPSCLQKLNLRECTELETVSFDALKNLRILNITSPLLNRLPKEIKSLHSLSIVTNNTRL